MIETIDNLQQGSSTKVLIGNDTSLAWDVSALVTPEDIEHAKFFVVGTYTRIPIIPAITENPLTATFFIDSSLTTETGSYNIDIEVFNYPQEYSDKRYVLSEAFVVVSNEFELTSGSESASQSELETELNKHVSNQSIHITADEKERLLKVQTATNFAQGMVKGSTSKDKVSIGEDAEMYINTISGSKIEGEVSHAANATNATTATTATTAEKALSVNWSAIKEVPTQFPPAPHTHTITDITGLDKHIFDTVSSLLNSAIQSHNTDVEAHKAIRDRITANENSIVEVENNINTLSANVSTLDAEVENLDQAIDNLVDANIYIGKVEVFTSAITNTAINEYIQSNPDSFLLVYSLVRINVIVSDEDNQLWRCNYVQESPTRVANWEKYSHYPNEIENSINSKFTTPVAVIQGNGKAVGAVKAEIVDILAANSNKLSFMIAIWGGWVLAENWSSEQFVIGQYYGNVYYQVTNNQGSSAVITVISPTPDRGVLMGSARYSDGEWGNMYKVADRDYVFSSVNSHNTDVEAHKSIRDRVTATEADITDIGNSVTTLGSEVSTLRTEVENLDQAIDNLVDANLIIGDINLFTSAVTDALLTARAIELVGTSEASGLRKNMQLIDNDNAIWNCTSINAVPVFTATWENIGGGEVSIATNTSFGIVKGSTGTNGVSVGEDGALFVASVQASRVSGTVAWADKCNKAYWLMNPRLIGNASFNGGADISLDQIGAAKTNHASGDGTYGVGNDSYYGHVKLADSVNSSQTSSSGTAVTPKAVNDAIVGIEIGGENLILDGRDRRFVVNEGQAEAFIYYQNTANFVEGKEYTITFDAYSNYQGSFEVFLGEASSLLKTYYLQANTWTRLELTITSGYTGVSQTRFDANRASAGQAYTLYVENVKLSEGNKGTAYSEHPKDTKQVGSWTIEENSSGHLLFKRGSTTLGMITTSGDYLAFF